MCKTVFVSKTFFNSTAAALLYVSRLVAHTDAYKACSVSVCLRDSAALQRWMPLSMYLGLASTEVINPSWRRRFGLHTIRAAHQTTPCSTCFSGETKLKSRPICLISYHCARSSLLHESLLHLTLFFYTSNLCIPSGRASVLSGICWIL